MELLDWILLGTYFAVSLGLGLWFARRAGADIREFFLGGSNLPWWLAGVSMVATTFAADTPLAVTELVARDGIAGNWLWWNMALGGMLTAIFFSRLWRRSGVLTDLEFIELRYSGKPAAFLRGFRSVYLGLFMNVIIMGWVNVALGAILVGLFGIPEDQVIWYIVGALFITAVYTSLSGLWGVAVTDTFQFTIAMIGCIVLAVLVVQSDAVGGLGTLKNSLPEASLRIFPVITSARDGVSGVLALSAGSFIAYIGIQWWASWYPGNEPGGGGYVAQRMLSTKDERQSLFATLFFQIAHYCIRPWPWIIVALASLILYPTLTGDEVKLGYIYAIRDYLPAGLRGVLVAAFFAAYMSTIGTHLNWGTSYLVNDLWKRFIVKGRDEKYYVLISRLLTVVVMLLSAGVTLIMDSIADAWLFLIECGAGLGLVLILRWFWWRINAWSEIAATAAPIVTYAAISLYNLQAAPGAEIVFPNSLFVIVSVTTVIWIVVTFITKPDSQDTLKTFYNALRPFPLGWKPVANIGRLSIQTVREMMYKIFAWVFGIVTIYSVLFLTHGVLLGTTSDIWIWLVTGTCSALIFLFSIQKSALASL